MITRYIEVDTPNYQAACADTGGPLPRASFPQILRYAGPPLEGVVELEAGTTFRECAAPPLPERPDFREQAEAAAMEEYGVFAGAFGNQVVRDPNLSDDEWESQVAEAEAKLTSEYDASARALVDGVPWLSRIGHASIAARLTKRGRVEACPDEGRRARYEEHFAAMCASHPVAPEALLSTSQRAVLANAADYGVAMGLADGEVVRGIGKIPGLCVDGERILLAVRDARGAGLWPAGLVADELDAQHAAVLAARNAETARAAELAKVAVTPVTFRPTARNAVAVRIDATTVQDNVPAWLAGNVNSIANGFGFLNVTRHPSNLSVIRDDEDGSVIFLAALPELVAKYLEWDDVTVFEGGEILSSDTELEALPAVVNTPAVQYAQQILHKILASVTAAVDTRAVEENDLRDMSTPAGRLAAERFRELLASINPVEFVPHPSRPHAAVSQRIVVELGVRVERLAPELVLDLVRARLAERNTPWELASVARLIDAAMAGGLYFSPRAEDPAEGGALSSVFGTVKRALGMVSKDPRAAIVERALDVGRVEGRPVRSDEIVRALQDAGHLGAVVKPKDHGWIKSAAERAGWKKKNVGIEGSIVKAFVQVVRDAA